MAIEIKFPDLGAGISEGQVIKWLVNEGDYIEKSENILYIETFKTMIDIPTTCSGKLLHCTCKTGDVIKAGDTIAIIETKDNTAEKSE